MPDLASFLAPPVVLAQAAQPSAMDGLVQMLPMFIGIILIMYFLVIRPQKKKEAERKAMLQALRKNDRVLTSGGLLGTVVAIRENEVTLKIDDQSNVRARFTLSSIAQVFRDDADSETASASKDYVEKAEKS